MLPDQMRLVKVTASGLGDIATAIEDLGLSFHGTPLSIVDITPGGSLRVGKGAFGEGEANESALKLTIGHQPTKESSPYGSVRTLIRFDCPRTDADGRVVNLAVQMTIVVPNNSTLFLADAPLQLVKMLCLSLLFGDLSDANKLDGAGQCPTLLVRLLGGEP